MKLNKTNPFMFGVTAEEDREMIFNIRLRLATEEAAEKAKRQAANQVEKTIQKMLLKGMSNEDIQDITEYKVEKIKAIREKLENSQKLS